MDPSDDKVYYPETIADTPFPTPNQPAQNFTTNNQQPATNNPNQASPPSSITDYPMPLPIVAHETLSSALNTKSRKILGDFDLADQGAIRIGKYTPGVNGEIDLTSGGITALDQSGNTTFSIDGDTGNATFRGEVQAGSLISGQMVLGGQGNGNGALQILGPHGNLLTEVDSSGYESFDSLGNRLVLIDPTGVTMYGDTVLGLAPDVLTGQIANIGASSGVFQLQAALGILMKFVCRNSAEFDMGPFSTGTLTVKGNFTVTGSKAASVETSQGTKKFYAAESLDDTFFFVVAEVNQLTNEPEIDPVFYECTEEPYFTIPTTNPRIVQFWGKRKATPEE